MALETSRRGTQLLPCVEARGWVTYAMPNIVLLAFSWSLQQVILGAMNDIISHGEEEVPPSAVIGSRLFAEHLRIVGKATGLSLNRVLSPEPRCELKECKRCDRELMIWDDGNNVCTINFLLETLALQCKLGEDFCIGMHEVESEVQLPFRVCLARSALRHMLEVYRLGEIVNRSNSGFLTALRQQAIRKPIDHSRIIARARRRANRVVADIQGGLSAITPKFPPSGSRCISPKQVGDLRMLFFHGDQLRKAARGQVDFYVHPKPDTIAFGHYHRLWAFEFGGMVCLITGCWVLTFPKPEIVLFPNIGVAVFKIWPETKALGIELYRYGGSPIEGR